MSDLQTFAGNAQVPGPHAMHSYGEGWWLYWNTAVHATYLVSLLPAGRTQLETFPGHVVPRCCAGGTVLWR